MRLRRALLTRQRASDQNGPKKCVFDAVDVCAFPPVRQVTPSTAEQLLPPLSLVDGCRIYFFHLIFVLWGRRTDKAGYNDRDVLSFETRAEQ
jgi:hypothetical protein